MEGDTVGAIAIVGMAGRFPGAADIDQLWSNLRDGVESVTTFTDEELLASDVNPDVIRDPNYVRRRAIVADIDLFDASYFGYSPREAEVIDPQQRMFLECSVHALEHAGHTPEGFSGRIGVFAGSSWSTYYHNNLLARADIVSRLGSFHLMLANDKDYLNTRTSYELDLTGPSVNVNTSCSTSLVAVHFACQSLLLGESDMALAGGVSLLVPVKVGYLYEKGGIMSPDGCCRAFDARAEGMVPGAGCGIVVLRRLEDALQDHDRIIAVIRGSAVNNDGSSKIGFTAPSVSSQSEVITDALAVAGVSADTIGYVEAHGTATPVGDPIEVAALTRAFRSHTDRVSYCGLGSIKTNIGHLGAAAGVAGLIKAALAVYYREVPPSLHYERPHPQINFAASPFYVNDRLRSWDSGQPRRAAVSSLGIGGTNAHVVLEQSPDLPLRSEGSDRPWEVLFVSGRSPEGVRRFADTLSEAVGRDQNLALADVAFTVRAGRVAHRCRAAVVASNVGQAEDELKKVQGNTIDDDRRPVQFFFTGSGLPYDAIRELYRSEPDFRREVDWCLQQLTAEAVTAVNCVIAGGDLIDDLWPGVVGSWAVARLLVSWGVVPDTVTGQGSGLLTAAVLSGGVEPSEVDNDNELIMGEGSIRVIDPITGEVIQCGELLDLSTDKNISSDHPGIRLMIGCGAGGEREGLVELGPGPGEFPYCHGLMSVVGELYCKGAVARPERVVPGGRRISLPLYQFDRYRYFVERPQKKQVGPVEPKDSRSEYNRPDLAVPFVLPHGELEQTIAAVWEELLGIVPVGRDDDFFDLGGHSLLATQVVSRLRQLFPVTIPLQALFDAPTIAMSGEMIEQQLVTLVEQMSEDDQ